MNGWPPLKGHPFLVPPPLPVRTRAISLPRALRQSFTRAAKKAFPAETFAFCLGTRGPSGTVEISYLLYAPIILDADGLGFLIPEESLLHAERLAKEMGTRVLSTLHSHPYPSQTTDPLGCAPSETDWDFAYPNQGMGICQVTEIGGKLRVRYRFWPALSSVKLLS